METTFQNFQTFQNHSVPVYKKPSTLQKSKMKEKPLATKYKVVAYAGSSVAAYGTFELSKIVLKNLVMIPLHKNFISSCQLTSEETKAYFEGGEKTLETSGLKAKGIQIKYLADSVENAEELKNTIGKVSKLRFGLHKIKYFKNKAIKTALKRCEDMITGENACYVNYKKTVFINEKKIINTVFHELGHAKSRQKPSLFLNFIDIKYKKYYPYLFLAALLLPKHKKENLNTSEKFDNKVFAAIPALTVAGSIPLLVEEAKASIYGKEFAKQVLKPELVKKVAKSYKKAYLTYLGGVISTFAIYKAIMFTKDKVDIKLREHFKKKQSV